MPACMKCRKSIMWVGSSSDTVLMDSNRKNPSVGDLLVDKISVSMDDGSHCVALLAIRIHTQLLSLVLSENLVSIAVIACSAFVHNV